MSSFARTPRSRPLITKFVADPSSASGAHGRLRQTSHQPTRYPRRSPSDPTKSAHRRAENASTPPPGDFESRTPTAKPNAATSTQFAVLALRLDFRHAAQDTLYELMPACWHFRCRNHRSLLCRSSRLSSVDRARLTSSSHAAANASIWSSSSRNRLESLVSSHTKLGCSS